MGPYNVDAVVEPLNIKISEAIMNFQEVGPEVSQKIQIKCGTLGLKRSVREVEDTSSEDAPTGEIAQQNYKFNHGKGNKEKKQRKGQQQREDTIPGLEKVIEDIQNVSIAKLSLNFNLDISMGRVKKSFIRLG